MLLRTTTLAALSALTVAACASSTDDPGPGGDAPEVVSARAFAVTASSVEALHGSLSKVTPPVRTADPGHTPDFYLDPNSALGPLGPLGAWGPLGALGPIGDQSWNASAWMSAEGDWTSWSKKQTGLGGPLSAAGPLGPRGPLSQSAYDGLASINDWSKQLQAGGVFTALGPLGPLGALGPLGPLGPLGAHGFAPNKAGDYVKGGTVMRTVDVPFDSGTRTYELVEQYTEAHAKEMPDNDTSFMVKGSIDHDSEVDTYRFTSREEQFVTVVVVPENSLSDFDVELRDGSDRVVARSDSDGRQGMLGLVLFTDGHYIDFAQVKVAAGAPLSARITAKTTNPVFPTYRVIVTGSTKNFATTDIRGPHQKPL